MNKLTEILKHLQTATDGEYDLDTIKEAEAAINKYIAEIIGEDEHDINDRTLIENQLKAEQRKRAGIDTAEENT